MDKEFFTKKVSTGNLAAEIRHKLPMFTDPMGNQAPFDVQCLFENDLLDVIIKPSKNYEEISGILEKFFARHDFTLEKSKEEDHYLQFTYKV